MSVLVDEVRSAENSRVTAIRITMMTLRCMENWRRNVKDYDSIMILIAVVAIRAERLTRAPLAEELRSLARPIPADQLSPCNVSSIAAATGLNRETVRRKVNQLVEAGFLVKSAEGGVGYTTGHLQKDYIAEMIRGQLDSLVRTVNDLCRDGTLTCDGRNCGSCAPG